MASNFFISVDDAVNRVLKTTKPGKIISISVDVASGYIAAASIKSPIDSPPFNNSAMDGYAFRINDFIKNKNLTVVGEVAAGAQLKIKATIGQAVRIFTGAPVPSGFDTVVMQEKVEVSKSSLIIKDTAIKKGNNIRLKGSQTRKGSIIINKGEYITPATVGYLASNGISKIAVYAKPSVAVIVTGDELVALGKKLLPGQIYESNEATLRAALLYEGITKINRYKVKDNKKLIKKAFRKAFLINDIILITGGISVGDYDYTGDVLKEEKVKTVFYKVKQKPGKPLFFGIKKSKYVFGLPGNPASVLTCYYEYVLPAIRKMQNHPKCSLTKLSLPIKGKMIKKTGLTVFYKAQTDLSAVKVLESQESYKLNTFAQGNCFVVLPENKSKVNSNEKVDIHLFPNHL